VDAGGFYGVAQGVGCEVEQVGRILRQMLSGFGGGGSNIGGGVKNIGSPLGGKIYGVYSGAYCIGCSSCLNLVYSDQAGGG
jgi:hypothetical protein